MIIWLNWIRSGYATLNIREWMGVYGIKNLFPSIPSHPQIFKFPYSTIFHLLPFSSSMFERKMAVFHRFFTVFSDDENGEKVEEKMNWTIYEKSRKKKGKIKENSGKVLKNMRANREGYGTNQSFRNSFLVSLKAICCAPVSFIASSCKTPTNPYLTTVRWHFKQEKEGRKREQHQPILTSETVELFVW